MKCFYRASFYLICCLVAVLLSGCFWQTNDLDRWSGEYEFYEFAPPNINMLYTINIYKENGNYFAKVNIDGFQTMTRVTARIEGDSEVIYLIFESYLPDNLYELFSEDDVMLSFKMEDAVMLTEWMALRPLLLENESPNKVYFTSK